MRRYWGSFGCSRDRQPARCSSNQKELAEKTRRGLRGRIELGKAGGGVSFGYRIVRRLENGIVTTGEREIVPEEAAIIRRIFNDYAAGASPKQIAKALSLPRLKARDSARRVG
jgi:DNA invertase Pin-like site-specific DNA recombinase